ncbi:hypothetical protein MRX96_043602 [Rhipicephalus microplus]
MCDPDFREYRGSGEQNASSPPATGQATVLKSSLGSEEKFMCMEGHQFLLQTARAWTVGPHKSTLVRLLLDGGSQRTFIHRKLSERLQLNVLGEEELKIYAFGDKSAITRTKARLVELWLQSQYDGKRARVEALEVPCICADIMAAPLNHLYVDDLVTGVDTLEQGKVLCQESSDILSQAGMRLHKWMSNDHDLVNFIEDGNVAKRNANAELPAATKSRQQEIRIASLSQNFRPLWVYRSYNTVRKDNVPKVVGVGSGLGRPLARIDASGVEVLV